MSVNGESTAWYSEGSDHNSTLNASAEKVRKPATGFADVQLVTALASDNIDDASRSAIVPSLSANFPLTGGDRFRRSSEVICAAPGSLAAKCRRWFGQGRIRVNRESTVSQDVSD